MEGSYSPMEGPYCVFGVTFPAGVYSPLSQHLRVLQRVIGPGRYVVVSVLLSRKFKLQTTRSSEFMGLSDKVTGNATIESDIIVVVFGSGIWPESKSFKTNVLVLLPKGGKVLQYNKKSAFTAGRIGIPVETHARIISHTFMFPSQNILIWINWQTAWVMELRSWTCKQQPNCWILDKKKKSESLRLKVASWN
ncbi:hypothetical protein ACFX2G_029735 [Malus domestica]